MFSGIVETTGNVLEVQKHPGGKRFIIESEKFIFDDLKNGDSISVNGACQTVEEVKGNTFQIFSVPETLELTNLDAFQLGTLVNLERPLKFNDRIGGHIVQGHIEEMAIVRRVDAHENYWDIDIEYESPYVIPKGSISLDGISLTIHENFSDGFRVQIIPETLKKTNIPTWKKGYKVNIETDYLIKAFDYITNWQKSREKN